MNFTNFTRMKERQGWAGLIVEVSCLSWVWLIGVWTLLCNAMVLRQATFETLLPFSAIALILAIVGFFLSFHTVIPDSFSLAKDRAEPPKPQLGKDLALPLGIAVILVIIYGITDNFVLFWSLATLGLAISYGQLLRKSRENFVLKSPTVVSWEWLLGLGALAIIATAIVHRTHGDDAFYLNLIVAALDRPDRPLMVQDTMHGVPNVPLLLPVYRVHSVELLAAVISQITGISHLWVRNFWQPLAIAPLVVFASALFFRAIVPRHWLSVTTVTTFLLVILTTAAGLGNFSLARLQQGKPLFVAILVPLIIVYTLRYLTAPSAWKWMILTFANIAAVGCSSTALYAAPLTVLLATCGYWTPTSKATWRSVSVLTTCAYPLAIALLFITQVKTSSPNMSNLNFEAIINNDFVLHLKHGMGGYFFWVATLVSWAVLTDLNLRRFLLGAILTFMLLFMNPFLQEFWAVNLTGVPTFRRLWWVIPRHLLLGILLSFPLISSSFSDYQKQAKITLYAFVSTALIVLATSISPNSYSPKIDFNRIQYRFPPQPKLPQERLDLINRIQAKVPPGSYVLAPASPVGKEVAGDELARWMIVPRTPLYPIVVTESYLNVTNFFPESESQQRRILSQYISGVNRPSNAPQVLQSSIPQLSIKAAIVPLSNPWEPEINAILSSLGFQVTIIDHYALWML
ncbi:MAG: hypothetical protein J7545_12330 [Roseofilum sp. SBFL]|uniref:DUF6077 domain-containing protein n=1 Tax=unclassified Roseofilum TaxID=2620099 RepID=UPI001B007360|nr:MULTISPECIES: DUF6077 domain-containing protein [unclassified Roseofilum]MBP0014813.1 hypothetical protein [Roseofilum sp. SID3]MBP0023705.1 hypothetical protein [Roseofilum sp. SID2]MBP0037529.1 hypothetical protein [Roseofilum sp. SID1]MBP0042743.1 hypothetical protein [Roseofilum sp. SBFL]